VIWQSSPRIIYGEVICGCSWWW